MQIHIKICKNPPASLVPYRIPQNIYIHIIYIHIILNIIYIISYIILYYIYYIKSFFWGLRDLSSSRPLSTPFLHTYSIHIYIYIYIYSHIYMETDFLYVTIDFLKVFLCYRFFLSFF